MGQFGNVRFSIDDLTISNLHRVILLSTYYSILLISCNIKNNLKIVLKYKNSAYGNRRKPLYSPSTIRKYRSDRSIIMLRRRILYSIRGILFHEKTNVILFLSTN